MLEDGDPGDASSTTAQAPPAGSGLAAGVERDLRRRLAAGGRLPGRDLDGQRPAADDASCWRSRSTASSPTGPTCSTRPCAASTPTATARPGDLLDADGLDRPRAVRRPGPPRRPRPAPREHPARLRGGARQPDDHARAGRGHHPRRHAGPRPRPARAVAEVPPRRRRAVRAAADEVLVKDLRLARAAAPFICDKAVPRARAAERPGAVAGGGGVHGRRAAACRHLRDADACSRCSTSSTLYVAYYQTGAGRGAPRGAPRAGRTPRACASTSRPRSTRARTFADRTIGPRRFARTVAAGHRAATAWRTAPTSRASTSARCCYVQEHFPRIRTVYLFGDFPIFADPTHRRLRRRHQPAGRGRRATRPGWRAWSGRTA